ncbi:MAG: magnesium transporter CorA family protein [archaeon]|jgi:magnesium transporter
MIKIYKKSAKANGAGKLVELKRPAPGCWINVVSPTEEEIIELKEKFSLPTYLVKDCVDSDSLPRLEKDLDHNLSLILLKVPFHSDEAVTTVPFGIVFSPRKNYVFTISSTEAYAVGKILSSSAKNLVTDNKVLFFTYITKRLIRSYMRELNVAENEISGVESSINKSFQNKEVLLLLSLQKTLVYFRTSIVGNKKVLSKIIPSKIFSVNEEEKELIEDLSVDIDEAQQLVTIYSEIIANMITAYNSLVANNFNSILKFLALITVAISIPTMVASFYGMNIDLPLQQTHEAFFVVVLFAILATGGVLAFFKYKNWV